MAYKGYTVYLLLLSIPQLVFSQVFINEVEWPFAHFAIVLIACILYIRYFWVRTERWQGTYLGTVGLFTGVVFLFPLLSNAAVIINEVAWMGDSDSATNEWIELYNSGSSAVNVDGWTLEDGASLSLALSGSVGAGSYAVLERTDDDSAPGPAFLIYSGALSNEGRTLTLRDSSNAIVDQVAGGDGWENLGGDNTTKETAQYTEGGWITAPETPGSQNSAAPQTESATTAPAEAELSVVVSTEKKRSGTVHSLELPEGELSLSVEAPSVGYVNQPVSFLGMARGIGDTLIDSLHYEWNFGDLRTGEGSSPPHTYSYPGEYTVVLNAHHGRHEGYARHQLTILPAELSLSRTEEGVVHLHNNAQYEVDVGSHLLVGGKTLRIPKHTIIGARGTISISPMQLKMENITPVRLYDSLGQMVAELQYSEASIPEAKEAFLSTEFGGREVQYQGEEVNSQSNIIKSHEALGSSTLGLSGAIVIGESAAASQVPVLTNTKIYGVIAILIIISLFGLYMRPRETMNLM